MVAATPVWRSGAEELTTGRSGGGEGGSSTTGGSGGENGASTTVGSGGGTGEGVAVTTGGPGGDAGVDGLLAGGCSMLDTRQMSEVWLVIAYNAVDISLAHFVFALTRCTLAVRGENTGAVSCGSDRRIGGGETDTAANCRRCHLPVHQANASRHQHMSSSLKAVSAGLWS
jgi:hypothetical protein